MEWKFEREEKQFESIPVGEHRVRIADVEKAISKSGNDMLTIKLDVSGYKSKLWHYITFLPEHPEITNSNLTQLFDSFGIEDGDFNLQNWKGKVGACKTKEDDYGTKVRYFIPKRKQSSLPPWKEMDDNNVNQRPMTPVDSDEELPF